MLFSIADVVTSFTFLKISEDNFRDQFGDNPLFDTKNDKFGNFKLQTL